VHRFVLPLFCEVIMLMLHEALEPAEREARVKAWLMKGTPTDIMEHTYNRVPLGSFSAFELCGIIHDLSCRRQHREDRESQRPDGENADPRIEQDI
jgi:hypothetical protein